MRRSYIRVALTCALSSASIIGLVAPVSPASAQTATVKFDIPATDLATALESFGKQSGKEIIFDRAQTAGKRSPAVSGALQPDEALSRLLKGSGLSMRMANAGTFVVEGTPQGNALAGAPNAGNKNPPSSLGEAGPRGSDNQKSNTGNESEPSQEAIVVTGTNIRGIANRTQPLLVYNRQAIQDSGYSDTQQFIRALPQNFGGGQNGASQDGALGPGSFGPSNNEGASGVNLRGLGNQSTLVLLNGHRVAPSAFGGIVDVSLIPISAIDRIDVLLDGASSVYGADAVGGVVNFILRHDYDGAETDVRYGSASDGAFDQYTASQTVGKDWHSGGALLTLQYQSQTNLSSSDRSFASSAPQPTDILPPIRQYTGIFSAHQDILNNLDISADALISHEHVLRRIAQSSTRSRISSVNTDQGAYHGTIGYNPFGDWRFELSGTYSREHLDFSYRAVSPLPAGYTLGDVASRNNFSLGEGDFKADGTLFSMASGNVRASFGGSYRRETYSNLIPYMPATSPTRLREGSRDVRSLFGELYIPLVGPGNEIPAVKSLIVSAAVRYDHYSDFGGTTNPKIGVFWSPFDQLDLRASWGTSFRPPDEVEQLAASQGASIYNYVVPASSGTGTERIFVLSGAGQNLSAEKSRNWSAGFDFHPSILRGAKVTLNYYNIHFRDRIITPPFSTNVLLQPQVYGSLVSPISDDTAAADFLTNAIANGATYFNIFGFGSTGVRYVFNDVEQNAAFVHQTGFDMGAEYPIKFSNGILDAKFNGTIIHEILTAFASGATPTDLVNTYANPLHFRARGSLSWAAGPWRVNGTVNFSNRYRDTSATPIGSVRAYTTVDLGIRYTPVDVAHRSLLSGTSFGLNITNLLNQKPPFVHGIGIAGVHYDVGNADPVGRLISADFEKRW